MRHEKRMERMMRVFMTMAKTTAPKLRMVWKMKIWPMVLHTEKTTTCMCTSGWRAWMIHKVESERCEIEQSDGMRIITRTDVQSPCNNSRKCETNSGLPTFASLLFPSLSPETR